MGSLKIVPLKAFVDNYIWLLEHGSEAVCADPGQAQPVLDYLRGHGLQLAQIWVTHDHADHTGGIVELKAAFPQCRVFGAADIAEADECVQEGSTVGWQGFQAQVWHTAGHTAQHVCYRVQADGVAHFFCGDTLFSAGCGRAFSGHPEWLYRSLQRIGRQPENTLLYPAHEYTEENLRFAEWVEPDNAEIQAALSAAKNLPTLPVLLAHERAVNPFLRTDTAAVRAHVAAATGIRNLSDEAVFVWLRRERDNF